MKNLEDAQQALAALMTAGAFRYSNDIATVTYEQREALLESIDPQPYELGYQLGNTNYLEKLNIDYNGSVVEMLRVETTWECLDGLRAFELEITEVPSSIILENRPLQQPKILTTTWWVTRRGDVVAYNVDYNGLNLVKLSPNKK